MTLLVAIETLDLGQVWGRARLGHVASGQSSSVGPGSRASVHRYWYVIKVSRGIGRVVLRTWRLSGRGVLSPILLVGSERGALILVGASA